MHFRRLEMHGFKSFAEPETIEFHPGITCIIGPNGSGKSNISDAIRWVLGEQSPKMLRGGKMEEVIFAGTASRKSRGMAEVTLVIDNTRGELPIDYNEVAITRRMFRSGESEYAINHHQCRLRDIRELIMDTGIGVDGYSLIGQGKISEIVSSKTESRREIFEEAAGIVMYRTRKAESEKKLGAASANLDRVNDIIGEIESRIGSLREESIKAEEYLKLRERYRELEINITLKQIEQLEAQRAELSQDLEELAAQLERENSRKQQLSRQLAKQENHRETIEQKLTESRENLLHTIEELNRTVNRGGISRERLSSIEKDMQRLETELDDVRKKLEEEKDGSAELEKTAEEIHREADLLDGELREKLAEHREKASELSELTLLADQKQSRIFQLTSETNGKKAEVSSLENLADTLEQRKQQILQEKGSGEEENRESLNLLDGLKAERDLLKEESERLAGEGKRLRSRQKEKLMDEQRLSAEMESLRVSLGQILARKKTIEEMESNYEGYQYAVKYMMKQNLSGICGTVAELITVPPGVETAIETALGGALQNMICETDRSAQQAISLLKQSKAGRLTFLPLESVRGYRGRRDEQLISHPGFFGYGTDCIEFQEKYRPAMEYLLGRVIIVKTMDDAVRLSKTVSGFRLVTLEGEVVNAGGAITGGRYKNKTANLLERKAEVTRLAEDAAAKQRRQQEGAEQQNRLRAELKELADGLQRAEERYRRLEIELLGKENRISNLENTMTEFHSSRDKWQQELERIETEQGFAGNMTEELHRTIEENEKESRELEQQIGQHREEIAKRQEELDCLGEAITRVRVKAGACETKKINADAMAAQSSSRIAELHREQQQKLELSGRLQKERDLLHLDYDGLEQRVKEKEAAKARLETSIGELTGEKSQLVSLTGELSEGKRQLDELTGRLQEQKHELEMKKARRETQMDACKEKLWDDFEISYIQAIEFRKKGLDMAEAEKENRKIKSRLKELGEVNIGAVAEYEAVSERYEFLTEQRADILEAAGSLNRMIGDMDKTIKTRFKESFDRIAENFQTVFRELFGGGTARLQMDDETNPLESGIDIIAQPPGKKLQNINLMSGGEKTMTGIALMFAVLKTKPTPFCILDEVEAALDDANIRRFAEYLRKFTEIQFTLVTHQKTTMEHADVLYGVTMPEQGVSKILSLDMSGGN